MFTDSVHQNKSVQFFTFEVVDSYNLVIFGGEKESKSERKGTKLARSKWRSYKRFFIFLYSLFVHGCCYFCFKYAKTLRVKWANKSENQ